MNSIVNMDSKVVHREDFERFLRDFIKWYWDQPLVARKLAGAERTMRVSVTDPRRTYAITLLDKVDEPDYAKDPLEITTDLSGRIVRFNVYQLSKVVEFGEDEYHQLFAGKDRVPLVISQLQERFAVAEDRIAFLGDENTGVVGLVGSDSTDLGAPSGPWGAATDKVLQNVINDVKKAINHFNEQGFPLFPIDMVVTQPIYTLLSTSFLAPYGTGTNLDLVRQMLRGGIIYYTNNIQSETVSATKNTALFVLRAPEAFRLVASEIQVMKPQKYGNIWQYKLGMRETFGVKVLNGDMICYIDEISVNSS